MNNRYSLFLLSAIPAIIVDQGSKWIAEVLGMPITYNSGVAFGAFAAVSEIVLIVTLLVMTGVAWWVLRQADRWTLRLGGVFVGAGFSNVLDRVWFEGVRDWMYVPILNVHNNLADWLLSLVVLGVFVREINLVLSQRKVKK